MSAGRSVLRAIMGAGAATAGVAGYLAAATGRVTLDLDIGRRRRALGPLDVIIDAPREVVHALIAEPYLLRTTRAMSEKLRVVERDENLVVAEHRTQIRSWLVATTVEAVRFTPPARVDFRLLRGPVPAVVESFQLEVMPDGRTQLHYEGTLETDLWRVGATWGRLVARHWTSAVSESMDSIRTEAERRRARHARTVG